MTLKQVSKIEEKITKAYEDKITTNFENTEFVDKSDILLEQMTFIALNNKNFFKF